MAPSIGGATSRRFISEELVEEILLRLPVKSMVRFKSVCKRWRSLLNSRPFIQLHLHRLRCDSSSSVHSTPTAHLSKMAPELADLDPSDRRLARSRRKQNWMRIVRLFGPLNNGGIYGAISRIVGVYSRPDEESDGVHIERLWFEDGGNKQAIVCDQSGCEALNVCKPSSVVYWNTAGISTYRETLEPLRTTLF